MISLDYSVVYQIVLFVVLWVILSKVLFRPLMSLLEERERNTTGAEHDLSELEHEAARLRAQYEDKIAQAQAAGNAAKEAILQEARQQREGVLSRTPGGDEHPGRYGGTGEPNAERTATCRRRVRAIAQEMATKAGRT
jgi:F-type H+-transporting ATPase subunit b